MSGQVTIKDIARQLGISASTVSRALKDHPDISAETKRSVNELAKKLKYQPNAVALSLKHSKSNTIGLIIPEIVHYFFSSVISGIEDVAYDAGFTVIICQSNEKYDREVTNSHALLAHRVDGILVSVSKETQDFEHIKMFQERDVPLVFFDRLVPGIEADSVVVDDRKASYEATKHLIEGGRKRIAHFAGPENLLLSRERKDGYLAALKEAGITPNPNWIIEADSFEKALLAVHKVMDLPNPPDGIFAVNDLTAIGAMKALQKKNIKIPEEIAIVGFSDGRFSGITEPNLTSVDQHGYEMGTIACQMLLNRILNPNLSKEPKTKILDANLIIRGSSI